MSFTDAQLDAEWADLTIQDHNMANSLFEKYQQAIEEATTCLGELRDLARMSLTEKRLKGNK